LFFPLKVELTKTQTGKEGCHYFYQLWTMDGKKVGAGLTIPLNEGDSIPVLKSCILSTLEPEEMVRLLELSQKTSTKR
jgi:phosphopantetheinyl transferase